MSINVRQIAEELILVLERRQEEDKYRIEGIVMLHNRIGELMEKEEKEKAAAEPVVEVVNPDYEKSDEAYSVE